MHTYCTNCGTKKENNGQLLCDECLKRTETAGGAEAHQHQAAPKPEALQWKQHMDAARNFAVRPMETVRAAYDRANMVHAAIIAAASSLIMALFGMLIFRKVWYQIFGIFGGFGGGSAYDLYDLSEMFFGPLPFPYGEVFFRLLFLFIIQWLLLALLITGLGRLAGVSASLAQSLTVVAYTKLILAACMAAALILLFIYAPLAIAIWAGGVLAGYLLIDRTVSDSSAEASVKRLYFMPAVFVVYMTAMAILSKIFF